MKKEGMQMEEAAVRRMGILSLANTFGVVYALGGLIAGIIFSAIFFLGPISSLFPPYLGFAVIIFPVAYGISGWISGVFFALFYNWAAKMTGGVKLYSY